MNKCHSAIEPVSLISVLSLHFQIQFAFRVPCEELPQQYHAEVLPMIDDTGSTMTRLWESDIRQIQTLAGGAPLVGMGTITFIDSNGVVTACKTYQLEVNVVSENGQAIIPKWNRIQVVAAPDSIKQKGSDRLSGIWLRHVMYTATVPDNKGRLYLSSTRDELVNALPDVPVQLANPPPYLSRGSWTLERTPGEESSARRRGRLHRPKCRSQ